MTKKYNILHDETTSLFLALIRCGIGKADRLPFTPITRVLPATRAALLHYTVILYSSSSSCAFSTSALLGRMAP